MKKDGIDRERWETARISAALVFLLVLYVGLIAGPMMLADRFGGWAGVCGAIIAISAWLLLGPRAGPAMVSGTLCVTGLFGLLVAGVLAIIRAL